jgi:hypothetical protein
MMHTVRIATSTAIHCYANLHVVSPFVCLTFLALRHICFLLRRYYITISGN